MTIIASKKHRKILEKQFNELPSYKIEPGAFQMGGGIVFPPVSSVPIRFITKPYAKKVRVINEDMFRF